ncbi:DUF6079 family protein [Photobacterium sp. TY1-4]|uniref:DUF6079 family protein n=1 Tax=Photobacterium sp. TY1-4 TaxID=2899122 RepID=UPI0021BEA66B|nr:DUF6079 family protein [Photobacterium sp. TY1-4]UXI00775.1 DUF6079 family protein [Photobacterium sp. TY1-4]
MSLSDHIIVRSTYTRSINVERHKSSIDSVIGYLPTSRAINTLERVADTFVDGEKPRSWSLVGPYGSGKSALAVFLSALLSSPDSELFQKAYENLFNVNSQLAHQFKDEVYNASGYLRVMISGSSESLGSRIVKGLFASAEELWSNRKGKNPAIVQLLEMAAEEKNISAADIVELISSLQDTLAKSGSDAPKGIILVIDELGKFLEYASRHEDNNDLFVLQAIAEHAQQHHEVRLLQFVMLHKSFDQYAQGLTEQAKNQWSAVHGRFEEIPFIENTEQVLRVVSRAIEQASEVSSSLPLKAKIEGIVTSLEAEAALPSLLAREDAVKLFADCYPLHPCSALLLPYLCQQVAQNERTLFSYLGSTEPYGFQSMLDSLTSLGDLIYPSDIYDYFISNQSTVLGDFQTQRRWVEVVTAVERLGDAPLVTIKLLKTIGVFNIVGAKGGLKASEALLRSCFVDGDFDVALTELLDKSIITHRKFNNEYRVWQGSDFDLQEALANEIAKMQGFPLANELTKTSPLSPIVARKYTIQTGTLRYFQPVYSDSSSVLKDIEADDHAKIIFYLSSEGEVRSSKLKEAIKALNGANILCVVGNSALLANVTAEIKAYNRIKTCPEVNQDPIAKKELEVNLAAALSNQRQLLNEFLYNPEDSNWYSNGRKLSINSKRDVQRALSKALDTEFSATPLIFNELINKDKPSSQAASGRTKLMKAMLSASKLENLGIEKFPPEKAMYMAIFKEHKLHVKGGEHFEFQAPPLGSLFDVWDRISTFLESTEHKPKSFVELTEELTKAPYGVKLGLLPIFYLYAYLVYNDDIALYEEGKYQPVMTEEQIDRFIKRPDLFTFQLYKIEGLNASLVNAYSEALYNGKNKNRKVINLARPLVKFFDELPEITQATRSASLLSKKSVDVRESIKMSKSPERLIFEDLPKALGFGSLSSDDSVDSKAFSASLYSVLRELKSAYPKLLDEQATALSSQLYDGKEYELNELRNSMRGQYSLVEHLANGPTRSFVKSLLDTKGSDEQWLENILISLSRKHPSKWKDQDLAKAEATLADLSRRLRELQAIAQEKNRQLAGKHESEFEVILLRSIKQSTEPKEKVVTINKSERKIIDEYVEALREKINTLDPHTRMAVLAQLIDFELPEGQNNE